MVESYVHPIHFNTTDQGHYNAEICTAGINEIVRVYLASRLSGAFGLGAILRYLVGRRPRS